LDPDPSTGQAVTCIRISFFPHPEPAVDDQQCSPERGSLAVGLPINTHHRTEDVKVLKKAAIASPMLALMVLLPNAAYAATSPSLGMANTFGILSSTYTNTAAGTTINGDLGYAIGPAVAPTVNGTTHAADGTYTQAGIDQGTALSTLNNQPCTFTFASGAIDLTADTTHGAVGVYTPGVYCITGAASVGGGTITLTGAGTYIFRMTGALDTSANSVVAGNGVSACNVWWTPGAATTLGANSTFLGTDIDASGITLGNLSVWTGRALAFAGTVSTSQDTITAPTCAVTPTPTPSASPVPVPTTPGLPPSGVGSPGNGVPWWSLPLLALGTLSILYAMRRKT
jgi:Ice-binding-like